VGEFAVFEVCERFDAEFDPGFDRIRVPDGTGSVIVGHRRVFGPTPQSV
jgi:hypothetical protein